MALCREWRHRVDEPTQDTLASARAATLTQTPEQIENDGPFAILLTAGNARNTEKKRKHLVDELSYLKVLPSGRGILPK